MDELSVHVQSKTQLDAFIQDPKHALLVTGESGTGTLRVAKALAVRLSPKTPAQVISPENGTIAVDTVRGLYAATRSSRDSRMIIIVDDADTMSVDAQNTLLKLLEEPPKQVYFILTSHSPQRLLSTILSRVAKVSLRPLSRAESGNFIATQGVVDENKVAKLLFLASGRAAELSRLMHDDDHYNEATRRMGDAKQFIEADLFGRLLLANKYQADRVECEAFLKMVGQLLTHMSKREPKVATIRALEAVTEAIDMLQQNANSRLQLLRVSDRLS